jgi:ATP-dependent Clp protease ATP-binding subunit ClpC
MSSSLIVVVGLVLVVIGVVIVAITRRSTSAIIELPVRKPVKIIDRLYNRAALEKRMAELPSSQTVHVNRDEVIALMKDHIFGQDPVIEDVVDSIWGNFLAENRAQPVGVFLLAGPPGSAKSRFGQALGTALYGAQGAKAFNLASYSGSHSGSGLFGAPQDHQGGAGMLSEYLIANPRSVVILDEFEKASNAVQRLFLDVWNDGCFTDHKLKRVVSTVDTIFIVTTNAQEDQMTALAASYKNKPVELEERVREVLKHDIENSVLSRIERVFVFQPLDRIAFAALVGSFIEEVAGRYRITVTSVEEEVAYRYGLKHYGEKIDGRAVSGAVVKDMRADFIRLQKTGVTRAKVGWNAKKNALSITADT